MQWLECTIECKTDTDTLCGELTALGVDGMVVEDEADFRAFLAQNKAYWDYVDVELEAKFVGVSRVKFYLPYDEAGRAQLASVRAAGYEVQTARIADEDWENNWRQYYKPIPIGEKLVVVPEWEATPDGGRLPLRLDPGLIFGTGSHATTRMCLEALETLAEPGARVLDLGCGSGILAIGALVLGCQSAVGCDIDPKAPGVARSNAALNGIGEDRFRVYAGDILTDARMRKKLGNDYRIVLANIVSDVIIPLAPRAREFMAEGATFVCSGIIEGRQSDVEAALKKAGFAILAHHCQEEWHAFVCK